MMNRKDSLWSWIVLIAVTFTLFLEIGIIKGLSVLLPDLKEQLRSQTWIIGACISLLPGWGYLLGLSAGPLVQRFGARICLVTTGILSSFGLIICACATSVHQLLLGFLFAGFMLLQENIAIGLVPHHFEKYFHTAVNVDLFGTSFAILVFPVVTQILLEAYGWRGALFILSGLCLHSVPCGILLTKEQVPVVEEVSDSIFIQLDNDDIIILEVKQETKESNTLMGMLGSLLDKVDASLFLDFAFIARVVVPEFVLGYTLAGWLIYVVSFALSNGATMREASIVATWGGLGAALVRFALPMLGKYMSYKQLLYLSSIIMLLSMTACLLWTSLLGMEITTCIFCIGVGILSTEVHIAAQDIVREEQFVNAISWLHLVYGFAAIVSGTLTGLLYDISGSFISSFIVLAAMSSLTMISLGVEDIYNGCKTTFR